MKRFLAIVMVALFCCGFVPQQKASRKEETSQKASRQEGATQKGVSFLQTDAIKSLFINRDTLRATASANQVLHLDPNYAPALHLLARIVKSDSAAVQYAKRAYLSDTTNHHYLKTYSRKLISNNDYVEATALFKEMVKRSSDPEDFYILTILLGGRASEAIAVVDTALVRFGPSPWFVNQRLKLLLMLGRTQEAEREAKKAVAEAPYLADNHIALAKVYESTKRDSLALQAYSQAVLVDTVAVEPKYELAHFCKRKGQMTLYILLMQSVFESKEVSLDDKIETWGSLIQDRKSYAQHIKNYDAIISGLHRDYPESRLVRKLYAEHLLRIDKREEALALYKQLLNQKSPSAEDFLTVIELERFLGQQDSAYLHNTQALIHHPKDVSLLLSQGYFKLMQKEYNSALQLFNEALKYTDDPIQQSNIWSIIGDMETNRGEKKRGFKAYEKALKYNPDNASVLNNYAYNLSLEGRSLERALEMITRAMAIEKGNATYIDTMAWVLHKLGRNEEAKKYMQQAISLDRDNSATLALHYGDILYALGEDFMAKVYWQKASERNPDPEEKIMIEERLSLSNSKAKDKK